MNFVGKTRVDFESVTSTNDVAREMIQKGCPEGTVIVALEQTQGRGKQGSVWFSPKGMGLYLSAILKPHKSLPDLVPLTIEMVRAVKEAVASVTRLPAGLKWPNDVIVNGRKAAGVLLESVPQAAGPAAVIVGIGVNLNGKRSDFPADLRETATTLEEESGRPVDREEFLKALLARLEVRYLEFLKGEKISA